MGRIISIRASSLAGTQRGNQTASLLTRENPFNLAALLHAQRPESLAERDHRLRIFDTLFRHVLPTSPARLVHDNLNAFRSLAAKVGVVAGESFLVPEHHLLDHPCNGHARQVGPPRCRCERQSEADQVVRGVADNRLIEVTDLNTDFAIRIRDRAEVSGMASPRKSNSADPGAPCCRRSCPTIRRISGCCPGHRRAPKRPSSGSSIAEESRPDQQFLSVPLPFKISHCPHLDFRGAISHRRFPHEASARRDDCPRL